MPAKSKSPEAAQRKVWQAELKQLEAAGRKVTKDHSREFTRLQAEVKKAQKKLDAFRIRAGKQTVRAFNKIESRIAVLRGRLGL